MSYSQTLANRIRERFEFLENVEEKEMMGGLTFMYNKKMCVGVIKDELMCRVNPSIHEELVVKTGCRAMDFTKRPMRGFIMIDDSGMKSKKALDDWINLALDYNVEAKTSKKKKK